MRHDNRSFLEKVHQAVIHMNNKLSANGLKAGAAFSGIGGFCSGFEQAGIKTVWAIENDPYAVQSYKHNSNGVRIIKNGSEPADINAVSVNSHNLEPVDVLHAGFPCQSFSQAGHRKGFDDPRGQLFFQLMRIIDEFKDRKPSVLVFENAPYLRIGEGGSWFLEIVKSIRTAGYWFRDDNCAELDTYALTELPQKRNRLFMVAFSIDHFKNARFSFPSQKKTTPKNLSEFIDFNGKVDDDSYYLHEQNRYFKMIKKAITNRFCIYQLRKYEVRSKEPGVCPTLTANMGLGGHNVPFIQDAKGIRKLTEHECLKLQGFNEFRFPDTVPRAKRYVQIGNSVAVPIASLLARKIRSKIEKERK